MKIILSRKGFDLENGGCASPIFPNGQLNSLPIPYEMASQKRFRDINGEIVLDRSDIGMVVEQLSRGRIRRDDLAHLDPDLDERAIPRLPGWRPAFGQADSAQGHLENQGVGPGDVFLFFGWFSSVIQNAKGQWCRAKGTPDLHVIFGWLQVGEVIEINRSSPSAVLEKYPWLRDHPHLNVPLASSWKNNVIYISSEWLRLPGFSSDGLPGAGVLRSFSTCRMLTAPNASSRSFWKLPRWFKGDDQLPWLSFHSNPSRWSEIDGGVQMQAVGRGQEFVLDCKDRPEAVSWLAKIIGIEDMAS